MWMWCPRRLGKISYDHPDQSPCSPSRLQTEHRRRHHNNNKCLSLRLISFQRAMGPYMKRERERDPPSTNPSPCPQHPSSLRPRKGVFDECGLSCLIATSSVMEANLGDEANQVSLCLFFPSWVKSPSSCDYSFPYTPCNYMDYLPPHPDPPNPPSLG